MTRPSSEFRLAAACCRWPPAPERDRAVREAAAGVDWPRLLAVARRQRVEGLVSAALQQAGVAIPAETAAELSRAAAEIARTNLGFAAESRRLHDAFQSAGLTALFIKGATLDMLAYGKVGLKRARDIDMVVDRDAVDRACASLVDLGYERTLPGPEVGPDRFPIWVKLCKETNWRHRTSGIIVELHSALVDNSSLLPGVGAHSPAQDVDIGPGIRLPTLRTEELFAYLCVHGATHAWSRLKWIADVAALLSRENPAGIERLYRQSMRLGVGRASAQAMLLCDILFQTPLPGQLRNEFRRDRPVRWLATLALRAMRTEAELDNTILGTVPIHLSHFLLGRGWRFRAGELARKLNNHEDQTRIRLPHGLRFLYPVISVPSWVIRRARGPTA